MLLETTIRLSEEDPAPPKPPTTPWPHEPDEDDDEAPETPPTEPPPIPVEDPPAEEKPKGPYVVAGCRGRYGEGMRGVCRLNHLSEAACFGVGLAQLPKRMAFPITIPGSQHKAFSTLARLSQEDFGALIEQLAGIKSAAEPDTFLQQLPDSLISRVPATAQIVATAISLRALIDRYQPSSVDDLVDGVLVDAQTKNIIESQERETLRARLRQLLSLETLVLSSKAFFLASEHPAPVGSVRIISDIRPIFASSAEPMAIMGSIVTHILKLESPTADDHFSALTTRDLRKLRDAVTRALDKDKLLRASLKGTPFACLDDTEE